MKVVLVAFISALFLSNTAIAQEKTDWAEDGLKGKVRSVRTEVADISLESGKYVEKERWLWSTAAYDVNGNKIEEVSYVGPSGTKPEKTVFRYNSRGKLIEEATYTTDGSLLRKKEYTYTAGGLRKEEIEYDAENNVNQKDVLIYNRGRLIKTLSYDGKGNLKSTYLLTYDSKGRRTSVSEFYSDNTLHTKYENTYDNRGNINWVASYFSQGLDATWKWLHNKNGDIVREDRFSADKSPHSSEAYTYEYDSHGNWTKQTRSEWFRDDGEFDLKPKAVFYRTITYY